MRVILESLVEEEGNRFGNVTTIFCQEWSISSCVVRYVLTTIDVWLKLALKMLVYRECGVNNSGCSGMSVGNKLFACRGRIVMLIRKILVSEVSQRESIFVG